jgi:hypothetical protein
LFAPIEDDGLSGVQRVKWTINMVAEYCEKPLNDGTAAPYDEDRSWPRKLHETGRMKWRPITVSNRQKRNSDAVLTIMMLQTEDSKVNIICRTPQQAGIVNGKYLTPVDTKCDIKISHWQYTLNCPAGRSRGLAIVTSVMSRYDDAQTQTSSSGDPTAHSVHVNSHKTLLKFQKTAKLRVLNSRNEWDNKGSVHMRMKVSKPHWIPDTDYQSHRHFSFSFGLDSHGVSQISHSELNWDPQLTSKFNPQERPRKLALHEGVKDLEAQPKITLMSFLGLTASASSASTLQMGCVSLLVTTFVLLFQSGA